MVSYGEKAAAFAGVVLIWSVTLAFIFVVAITLSALAFGQPTRWMSVVKYVNSTVQKGSTTAMLASTDSYKLDFLSDSNIIVFNASSDFWLPDRFSRYVKSNSEGAIVNLDYANDWEGMYEMYFTRIYYIGESNREPAKKLDRSLPGEQFLVDYRNQHLTADNPEYWPDHAEGDYLWVINNLDPSRDLAVFTGNDISGQLNN